MVVFLPTLIAAYFGVGLVVRRLASIVDEDGLPDPKLWTYVPAKTTAYLQRKGNRAIKKTGSLQATPAGGSAILDVIHAVPGYKIDGRKEHPYDLMKWSLIQGIERHHRRGLFYYLYGVHWLGPFMELRINKVREVRLSINEEDLKKAIEARKRGEKVKMPTYEELPKEYDTAFVYHSREHGVVTRGSETAGAFELDIYGNVIYEEQYPVRARLEVADANATLTSLVNQQVGNETAGHEPEYFLFEKTVNEDTQGKKVRQRRQELAESVENEVRKQAAEIIGISVKKYILYSVEMDDEMRKLLELQETTEREEQKRILEARREVTVAIQNARKDAVEASGKRRAQVELNTAEADRVNRVILPIAREPRAAAVRFFEAYENNNTVTSFAMGDGLSKMMPDNVIIPVGK